MLKAMAIHESRRKAFSLFGTVNLVLIVILPCLTFIFTLILNLVYASLQWKFKWSTVVTDANHVGKGCGQGLGINSTSSLMKSWCDKELVEKGETTLSLPAFKIHLMVIHEAANYESTVLARSQLDALLDRIQNAAVGSYRPNESELTLDVHVLHDVDEGARLRELPRKPIAVRMRKMKSFVLAEIIDLALEIQASDYGLVARNEALRFCRVAFGNDLPQLVGAFHTPYSSVAWVIDSISTIPEEFPKALLWSSALTKDLPSMLGVTIQTHESKSGPQAMIASNIAVFDPKVWKDLGVFLAKLRAEWFLWPDAHLAKKRDDPVWTKFNSSRSASWQQWMFRFQHLHSFDVLAVAGLESSFDAWKTQTLLNIQEH